MSLGSYVYPMGSVIGCQVFEDIFLCILGYVFEIGKEVISHLWMIMKSSLIEGIPGYHPCSIVGDGAAG